MIYENPDVVVTNQGHTVVMVQPITEGARDWVNENVATEPWQWSGPAFAVDPRFVSELIDGMQDAGLTVAA